MNEVNGMYVMLLDGFYPYLLLVICAFVHSGCRTLVIDRDGQNMQNNMPKYAHKNAEKLAKYATKYAT